MAERQGSERSLAIRRPREMEDWAQRWEDFFNRPFLPTMRQFFPSTGQEWSPSIDVMEKENAYIIKAELPGVNEEDVEVSLTGDVMTISGEKEEESEEERTGYYYSESSYGSFSRSLTIPSNVNADNIEASYNNGVLEITLPKTAEAKPKRVRVTAKRKESTAKSRNSARGGVREVGGKAEMKEGHKEEAKK
jgi:HSP20 family protein